MKEIKNYLWLIGVVIIIAGLLLGLKVDKNVGTIVTIVGMVISALLVLISSDKK